MPTATTGPADFSGVRDFYRVSGPAGDPNPKADIGACQAPQYDIVSNAACAASRSSRPG